jgi:hypothetical protein
VAPQGRKKRKTGQAERPNRTGRDTKRIAEERYIKARLKLLNSRLQLISKQALSLSTGCEQASRARRTLSESAGSEIPYRLHGKLRQ